MVDRSRLAGYVFDRRVEGRIEEMPLDEESKSRITDKRKSSYH